MLGIKQQVIEMIKNLPDEVSMILPKNWTKQ